MPNLLPRFSFSKLKLYITPLPPFLVFRIKRNNPHLNSIMKPDTASSPKSVFRRLQRKLSPKMKSSEEEEDIPQSDTTTTTTPSIQLQMVFNFFDQNRDGKISAAELQTCVKTVGGDLSMEEAAAAVESLDKDGDGLLGLDEFRELMEGTEEEEEEKKKELRQAFGMYVMNDDHNTGLTGGCITPQSLKRMLSRLGDSRSIDDCKTMIRAFDLNGDGVLSFDEFTLMMA